MKSEEPTDGATTGPTPIPTGLESLLLMAAEDERLRQCLTQDRIATLDRCKEFLSETERRILETVSDTQLEQMLGRLEGKKDRREFLRVAAASVVALVAGTMESGCIVTHGAQPDRPRMRSMGIRPEDNSSRFPSPSPSVGPSPSPGSTGAHQKTDGPPDRRGPEGRPPR